MSYYMRYIVTDDRPLSLSDLQAALTTVDADYSITDGELGHGAELYGEIEINVRGEELCDEELGELRDFVEEALGENKERVMEALRSANAMVVVRVLWQGRDSEPTLEKIAPLWQWLFSNREGLMQADGEGYYDASGLILAVE